jgi:hypothetical protein
MTVTGAINATVEVRECSILDVARYILGIFVDVLSQVAAVSKSRSF